MRPSRLKVKLTPAHSALLRARAEGSVNPGPNLLVAKYGQAARPDRSA